MSPSTSAVRCCTTCGAVYRAEYARCLNDGAELVMLSRDPLVGANVGPYVVDALLGEGGMGRVYRVHHARLPQKRYALKVLLGDFAATPPMRMRFAKEAQSASRLSHPNVVAVCDFGVTDAGLAYLAMDLVEGTPLSELITSRPMAPHRVIHLARQLCMGLAHAHDLGLIHRDFKPDNIIVVDGPAGEVPRIADFGLAITNDASDVRLTTSGMVLGTPAYVAPEQVTGSEVDHRADLYALGVTLFELLSGGFLPFDGDAAEVVGLKATMSAPSIADVAPDVKVPPALAAIVDRLLARRPADRHADARAVVEALDEAVRFPDDASNGRVEDTEVRALRADADPPRRRAARADDAAAAIELAVTTPAPFAAVKPAPAAPPPAAAPSAPAAPPPAAAAESASLAASPGERPVTASTTERVPAQRSPRRFAILAGAIVLAGVIVAAVVWVTRPAEPASAEPASAIRPAPAPSAAVAAAPAPAAPGEPAADSPPASAEPPAPAIADRRAPARPERVRPPKRTARARTPKDADATAAPAPRTPERDPAPASAAAPPEPPITARAPALPPVPAPPDPPTSAPVSLAPRLASLDVHGALPNATVRHALDRVLAGALGCRSDRAGAAEVRFTIGESRRAADLRATGLPASRCLAAALAALRTESAPDVGDVEVRVRFTYDAP